MEQRNYTISIYAENNVGLLSRVSAIFLKRHINIDSLNTSMSEIENIFRFVIVSQLSEEQVKKIVKQIDKQIEVIKAFYHTDEETIFQESALYKVKSNSLFEQRQIQNVIKKITKIKPKFSTTGGTSDARFIRKIAPCLEFGLVGKTMHKIDEAVSLKDLRNLTKIYLSILKNYF